MIQYSGANIPQIHLPRLSRFAGAWMCRLHHGWFWRPSPNEDRPTFGETLDVAYRMWCHSNPKHAERADVATRALRVAAGAAWLHGDHPELFHDAPPPPAPAWVDLPPKWTAPLPPSVCSEPYVAV